jgi:hypothetical protein
VPITQRATAGGRFATGIRVSLLPVLDALATTNPGVEENI